MAQEAKKEEIKIAVEEPNKDIRVITLDKAITTYKLDANDVDELKAGKTVWCGSTALSKEEEAF